MPRPALISADDLRAALDQGDVRVLDVRWSLQVPDGRPAYLQAHVPGALYVDLDRELARHGQPADGRHPLPSIDDLQDSARRWGIDDDSTVVVYDAGNGLAAARAWWLLRWAGVADVRLLDGGLALWRSRALAVASGEEPAPRAGGVTLAQGRLPTLGIDEAAALAADGLLLDARATERYRGDVEPVDPRAGHIPGAVSAPTTDNLAPDGRLLPADALDRRFAGLGAQSSVPVGVYCGSGVTAAHQALALTVAGYEPVLYPGSWSQWSHHPDRPVAVGDRP